MTFTVAVAVVDARHQVAPVTGIAGVRGLKALADAIDACALLGAVHGAVLERAVD